MPPTPSRAGSARLSEAPSTATRPTCGASSPSSRAWSPALGLYLDLAGPMGDAFRVGFGAVFGVARVIVPVALVLAGIALIVGPAARPATRGTAATTVSAGDRLARLVIGSLLVFIAISGALQLSRGRPSWGDPLDDFIDAGGALGWVIAAPLVRLVSIWGAPLVLAAVGIIGVLVLTGVSLRDALRPVVATFAAIGRSLANALRSALGEERSAEPAVDDPFAAAPTRSSPSAGPPRATCTTRTRPRSTCGPRRSIPTSPTRPRARDARHPSGPKVRTPAGANGAAPEQLDIGLGPANQRVAVADAVDDDAAPIELPGHRRAPRRRTRPHPRDGPGGARRRDPPGRHGRRPDRHPLRARARPWREGGPRHQPQQGHRLRHGVGRRPHPGPDPGPPGHRRRGPQHRPSGRGARRHPRLARGSQGHPPPRGRRRPRHQRRSPS